MDKPQALVFFAGLGLVDIELVNAGFDVAGIELVDRIAQVARKNGHNTITMDVLNINPEDYKGIELFHSSPPCPNFSQARNKNALQSVDKAISDLAKYQSVVNGETELDIALARKIILVVRVCKPKYVTIENVYGYRNSLAWLTIQYGLEELGYGWDTWNLNSADYGVAQTRRRMIVIARRDGRKPAKPFQTHSNKPDMFTTPWVGWYEAIEDLIPSLPDSEFAPWQLDRLPDDIRQSLYVSSSVESQQKNVRAYLAPIQGEASQGFLDNEPAQTIAENHASGKYRAVLIGEDSKATQCPSSLPAMTVVNSHRSERTKAFVIGAENASTAAPHTGDAPMYTVTEQKNGRGVVRGLAGGRVVQMTPRAMARFQSMPDSYQLEQRNGKETSLGIGNGLPCGLYRAVLDSLGLA